MLVGILAIIIGAAAGATELVPKRHRRKHLWTVAGMTITFGITNLVIAERGSSQLAGKIDRYGTVTNWQASEATLEVEGPDSRKAAAYGLVVKIIPEEHERVRQLRIPLRPAHSLNEPSYVDDKMAQKLFWIMADAAGTVDVLNEYRSGIYTYYYTGLFDENARLVRFHPDALTYWPALYPSLADLQGKFIVARVLAMGVDHPIYTDLRLKLGSPAGAHWVIMLPKLARSTTGDPPTWVAITSPERYIGGRLADARFLPN
jgi:hypothetical protein